MRSTGADAEGEIVSGDRGTGPRVAAGQPSRAALPLPDDAQQPPAEQEICVTIPVLASSDGMPASTVAAAADAVSAAGRAERRMRRTTTGRAFRAIKAEHAAELTTVERIAERLTTWASSTPMLVGHVIWFGVWITWNTGLLGFRPFDPFPFGLLTMVVSLEAIFLSIFVLMSQSREAAIAELREELSLQVNLRMEEEVTKTLQLVAGLYTRLGQRIGEDAELQEMLQPLDTKAIEAELISQIRSSGARPRPSTPKRRPETTPS